ncbi:hypothetical protein AGMMS49940_02690 [Spirochaetia bacterium]|nr:hypothetical protein AGMMS49940_02690 [Spirochaetia bacterium]
MKKNGLFVVMLGIALALVFTGCPNVGSGTLPPVTVAKPTATPNGGNIDSSESITLTSATAGAAIYYTTDGTTPTASSTLYTPPFTLSGSGPVTVKAIAELGGAESAILEVVFNVLPPLSGSVSITPLTTPTWGQDLFADTTSLGGSGSISYEWQRDGVAIDGATSATYRLTAEDEDTIISVNVSYSDNSGFETASTTIAIDSIGGAGEAGGTIIYWNANHTDGPWDYLEAAPADIGLFAWWPFVSLSYLGTTDTTVGSGRENTIKILAANPSAPAALVCKSYSVSGYNDWFLPSIGELSEMYSQRSFIGLDSSTDVYLSSSEANVSNAETLGFSSGSSNSGYKYTQHLVRAVRYIY